MFGSLKIFPCLKPFLFTSFLDLDNIFIVQASFYKIICLYMCVHGTTISDHATGVDPGFYMSDLHQLN